MLLNFLPFVLEGEEGADFEEAGGDINGLGDLAPVVEVADDLPVFVAVVHNEEFASGLAYPLGHQNTSDLSRLG